MPTPSTTESRAQTMQSGAKNELKSILATYRARRLEAQEREANIRTARAAFVESFRALKAEKIGPVLDEFVAELNEAGHQASVVDQQEASDRNGQFTPASIALRITPPRIGDSPGSPAAGTRIEVTFSANQHTMKVLVSSSNNSNGTSGRRGDHELAELTTAFVEKNVLQTIREAYAIGK